jgi:hypothetical protein
VLGQAVRMVVNKLARLHVPMPDGSMLSTDMASWYTFRSLRMSNALAKHNVRDRIHVPGE